MQHKYRQTKPPADSQLPALGLLFLAGCPLVLWVFHGSVVGILAAVLLLTLFGMALHEIRQGQRVHMAYDAAEVAYRPRFPRKIFGCVLIGLLAMILAASQFASLWPPLGFGMLATLLGVAAFGPDPMRDKGTDNPEVVLRLRATEMMAATETALSRIIDQVADLQDADLTRRTDAMRVAVMRLLRALSSDPAELRALRKPLMKFLQMVLFEVDRLVESWPTEDQCVARKRYVAKLGALSKAFEARARKQRSSATHDAFELETDLLLDRMAHETAA